MGDSSRHERFESKSGYGQQISLPCEWVISERILCDLELIVSGAMAPVSGFMNSRDYYGVLHNMRLTTGEVWPMPIVFPVKKDCGASNLHWEVAGERQDEVVIGIRDSCGTLLGELIVDDVFEPDLELEKKCVLGTVDKNHPYVKYLDDNYSDCFYVGGAIRILEGIKHYSFADVRMTTEEAKDLVQKKGYTSVVGFQTRNPMHRSHVELTKMAMREVMQEASASARSSAGASASASTSASATAGTSVVGRASATAASKPERGTLSKLDGVKRSPSCALFLTPAVGPTQPGDIDFSIRVHCYRKVMEYYESEYGVHLILMPIAMRMAGPREALWHALLRKNYGCTHFIIGRDHAGPSAKTAEGKSFYGPYAAHELIKSVQEEIGVTPIFGKSMKYAGEKLGYLEEPLIPKDAKSYEISGTKFREMLINRQEIPSWYSYPNVITELQKFYKPKHLSGFVIYFTGLPCSGKSTLALATQATLLQNSNETRKITLLDADVVRTHLSKGLGFTKADRSTNVQRIGYVAAEIAKHNGICLVANIAPYSKDRTINRELIQAQGGTYIEVFVNTPMQVCEARDPKGLYKQARQGTIKHFTGVSDPYQPPTEFEIETDCARPIEDCLNTIMRYLISHAHVTPPDENDKNPEMPHIGQTPTAARSHRKKGDSTSTKPSFSTTNQPPLSHMPVRT